MRYLLLVVLFSLPSCRFMDNVSRGIELATETKAEFTELKNEVKAEITAVKAEIDVNADGKISSSEFFGWVSGGGAAALLATIVAIIRNGRSNERKARNEAETAAAKQAAEEAKRMLASLAGHGLAMDQLASLPGFLDAKPQPTK